MRALLRLLKRTVLEAFGTEVRIKPTFRCNARFYGSDYGGFYLNPDVIGPDSVVYSFGIGEDISFDTEVISLHNCQVHGFDPTPKSIKWVKSQELPENFVMHEYGIARETGVATFYLPKNENFVSGSLIGHGNVNADVPIQVPVKSFADIIVSLEHKVIDVLKMDIEGAEYDVLESILESQTSIGQLVIEFHHRFFEDGGKKNERAVFLLRKFGFEAFAVSQSGQEVSFIKMGYI